MSALQSLLINSVWVVGLAGLLATFGYLDWYRTIRRWTFRETFLRPLALVPLYASLACFCAGLLLSEIFFGPVALGAFSFRLWKPLLWAVFTVIFTYQSFQAAMYGRRDGWDMPLSS